LINHAWSHIHFNIIYREKYTPKHPLIKIVYFFNFTI